MGWLKSWWHGESDFDEPVDPQNARPVTVIVKVMYRDGNQKAQETTLPQNQIPELVKDLMNFDDVTEARVFEEVSRHHKRDGAIAAIALGATIGTNMMRIG